MVKYVHQVLLNGLPRCRKRVRRRYIKGLQNLLNRSPRGRKRIRLLYKKGLQDLLKESSGTLRVRLYIPGDRGYLGRPLPLSRPAPDFLYSGRKIFITHIMQESESDGI